MQFDVPNDISGIDDMLFCDDWAPIAHRVLPLVYSLFPRKLALTRSVEEQRKHQNNQEMFV